AAYQDLLKRQSSPGETAFWLGALEAGTGSLAGIAGIIVRSGEYRGILVTGWDQTYLNRTPSAAEREPFAGALAPRPREARQKVFLQSDEYWTLAGGNATGFIRKVYQDLLSRPASDSEVSDRLVQYSGRDIRAFMPADFLASREFYQNTINGWYY